MARRGLKSRQGKSPLRIACVGFKGHLGGPHTIHPLNRKEISTLPFLALNLHGAVGLTEHRCLVVIIGTSPGAAVLRQTAVCTMGAASSPPTCWAVSRAGRWEAQGRALTEGTDCRPSPGWTQSVRLIFLTLHFFLPRTLA